MKGLMSKKYIYTLFTSFILFTLTLFSSALPVLAYDPMIRPDPRVDRFVHRMYARYGVLPPGAFRQPMGTAGFLSYLDSLSISMLPLTALERHTLNGLRNQLSYESGIYGFVDPENEYGFLINLDLTGEARQSTGGGQDRRMGAQGTISPHLRGYAGKLSFYSTLDVWTEYSDIMFPPNSFQPYNGVPYTLHGARDEARDGAHMRASNLPRAGISYDVGERLTLQAALDYLRIGPAERYPVTLSGYAPPITYARYMLNFTNIEYFHVVGILRSQKDKPKYIYANGLRGALFDNRLQWGISEVMIGGSTTNQQDDDPHNTKRPEYIGEEQGFEWAFAIPFVPMVFAEFYTGDKSNAALAFDFSLNLPQNFRFYGELYIDDLLSPWHFFSDDWGNKWAVTLGMQYFTNTRHRDVSAGLEWSRVEPWVYTHFYGGSHRYDHFNTCLGSPAGPNSMAITAYTDMSLFIAPRGTLGLKLTSLSNNPEARGGKITDIFQDPERSDNPDSEIKKFLGQGSTHHLRPGIYLRYDPFGIFRLNVAVDIDIAKKDRGRTHLQVDGGFRF